MKVGKVPENVLKRSVFKQIHTMRPEVVLGAGVGEDCAAVQLAEDETLVMSTDPITGTAKDIGTLAIQITVNDLASAGAEPVGVLLTVLLPTSVCEQDLCLMMKQVEEACAKANVQVMGGHTEVTRVVNQPVISVCGVGKVKKGHLISTAGARPGMDILVSKWIGIEGTSIIAKEKEEELKKLTEKLSSKEIEIEKLKKQVEDAGLNFDVIESIPVHEDIKLGKPSRDKYIENYCENIRRVAEAGVKCICYNFMPVFDWTRTQLDHELEDGSTSLVYYQEQVDKVNPLESDSDLTLPGWDASYTREELKSVVAEYNAMSEDDLWNNLQYFLEKIIPVAAECDVNMAIHEDDPCWSIFGLPRIITCEENLDRFLKLVDDKHNGITLCAGSLGCSNQNDVAKMAAKYAAMGRIHFVHMRNVQVLDNGFEERAHLSSCGSLDMYAIMKALYDNGFRGYIRPDHGRMIWGETGRAGYGLYDRALGATYLNGLWEAIEKASK